MSEESTKKKSILSFIEIWEIKRHTLNSIRFAKEARIVESPHNLKDNQFIVWIFAPICVPCLSSAKIPWYEPALFMFFFFFLFSKALNKKLMRILNLHKLCFYIQLFNQYHQERLNRIIRYHYLINVLHIRYSETGSFIQF